MPKPVVWCIGATDSGGGAGLHADIRACAALEVHAAAAVTAVTAQSGRGVRELRAIPAEFVASQLGALSEDLPADAIKIGALADAAVVGAVDRCLGRLAGARKCPVVLDPIVRAGVGRARLLADDARSALRRLCARAQLLTPNLPEAEWLLGRRIRDPGDVERAARELLGTGARSVLIKGGHAAWRADTRSDYWHDGQNGFWLHADAVNTAHSHGSGCVLASAIAAALARGHALKDALVIGRAFLNSGLRRSQALGAGAGPVGPCSWPASLKDLPRAAPAADSRPAGFAPAAAEALAVYPITDRADHAARLMDAGAGAVQLRIKAAPARRLNDEAARAANAARRRDAALYVNDHWRIALSQRAAGVHLGQEDLAGVSERELADIAAAGLALGISTHGWWEVARAHAVAPSYVAVGPVFATPSKPMSAPPQGIGGLQRWCEMLAERYTVIAIGGLDAGNAALAFAAGAHGIAMIRAVNGPGGSVGQLPDLLRIATASPILYNGRGSDRPRRPP